MKKAILTLAIVLGMTLAATAQGGLFGYGAVSDESYYGAGGNRDDFGLLMPNGHGNDFDYNGQTGDPAPLGGGTLLLIGFGAAYAVKKRKVSSASRTTQTIR